jgi:hypothetical protein
VKTFWMRTLVVSLVLACAGLQLAPESVLRAIALTLSLDASDHAHSISLFADGGHVDLVLSHEELGGHHPGGAHHHGDPTSATSERDHVFHLTTADDAANTMSRRAGLAASPALATAIAVLPAPATLWLLHHSLEPRARSSDSLRTVVLRL